MEFAGIYLQRCVQEARPGKVVYHYFRVHNEYNKLTKSLILPRAQVSVKVCPLPTRLLRIHEIAIFPETLDRSRAYDGYGVVGWGEGGSGEHKNKLALKLSPQFFKSILTTSADVCIPVFFSSP